MNMNFNEKIAAYNRAFDHVRYFSVISVTFSLPDGKLDINHFGRALTVVKNVNFFGVKIKLIAPIRSSSKFSYVKYLINHDITNVGDEKILSYGEFFDGFMVCFMDDVKSISETLVHMVDNEHFTFDIRLPRQSHREIDVEKIITRILHEKPNIVLVRRRCLHEDCRKIDDGSYPYPAALRIVDMLPKKPSFDLHVHRIFPTITRSRKQYYSFS